MPLSPFAAPYDHLLADLDGCVWVGDEPTGGAVDALEAWRAAGKGLAFVTNDGRVSGEDLVRKLWRLGFKASLEEVVTVGGAMQHVLAERADWRTAFVIGSEAIWRHVEAAGKRILNATDRDERSDVVVVAAHGGFAYDELTVATRAVLNGADLLGAARDPVFPSLDGPCPGSGAVLAAVETATGATAATVGKPDPQLFRTALDRLDARSGDRVLVVGDRVDADIAGAHAAGLDAALVLTGSTAAAPEGVVPGLVKVSPSLADLLVG